MTAIKYDVFDDLLIGNFMKTTLHGEFGKDKLYPDFTPYVSKYADNGKARTKEELERYFEAYRKQAPYDFLRHILEANCRRAVLHLASSESVLYKAMARSYHFLKGL